MLPKINIIGCGRLGKTVAYLICQAKLAEIQDVCNSTLESAKEAVEFIGQGRACTSIESFSPANIYFIGTSDDKIVESCFSLIKLHNPKPGSIIFHCSGAQTSDSLNEAKKNGCYVASIHPLTSIADPNFGTKNFNQTYCAFEGDESAREILWPLFSKIGGIMFAIKKEYKSIYHAGSVFASNYLVTLSLIATECYQRAGVPKDIGMVIANNLMFGTLKNIELLSSHEKALTGPLQRGDIETVSEHIKVLEEQIPQYAELYKMLGKCALPLVEKNQNTDSIAAECFNCDDMDALSIKSKHDKVVLQE